MDFPCVFLLHALTLNSEARRWFSLLARILWASVEQFEVEKGQGLAMWSRHLPVTILRMVSKNCHGHWTLIFESPTSKHDALSSGLEDLRGLPFQQELSSTKSGARTWKCYSEEFQYATKMQSGPDHHTQPREIQALRHMYCANNLR